MSHKLTEGALARICAEEEVQNVNVQVLGHRGINQGSGQERFRLLLSDGKYSNSFCMLATQHNERLHNKELEMFTILRLTNVLCNETENPSQKKRVIIVLDFDVIAPGAEVGNKIGSPIAMASDGSAPDNQNTNPNAGAANNQSADPNAGAALKRPAGPVGGQPPFKFKTTPASNQPEQRSSKEQDDIEKIVVEEASFREASILRENQMQAEIACTEQLLKETQNTLDKQKQLEAIEASLREASKSRENQVQAEIAGTEQILKETQNTLAKQKQLEALEVSFREASKLREKEIQVKIAGAEQLLKETQSTLDKQKQLEAAEATFREASKLREDQIKAKIAGTEQILKEILDKQKQLEAVEASFVEASKMRENEMQVEIAGTEELLKETQNTLNEQKLLLDGHKAISEAELAKIQKKKKDLKTMMRQRTDENLVPECPVCYEKMNPPMQIYTCGNGHVICSVCKEKVNESGNKCINCCGATYAGRATAMEQMIRQIFSNM